MQYQQLSSAGQHPYPDHDIDPSKKGRDWCMQYAKAAYYDWQFVYPKGIFSGNGGDYSKFRLYSLGKQPLSQYKKWLGVDETTNNTWLSIDWTIRPIVSAYRDKAISRLMSQEYNIVAVPIDQQSKTEVTNYYNDLKARISMMEVIREQMPELQNHPAIALEPGEPQDIEELQMRMEFGEQFNRSKDAEMAVNLAFYQNDYKTKRRKIFEDLFDLGVSGVKDWLSEDGKPCFRVVDPECIITSYTKDNDFSSIVHAGEIIDVPIIELAQMKDEDGKILFDEKELTQFAQTIAGQFGNPRLLGLGTGWMKPYDKFKCKVLDIEFYTYNERVYRDVADDNGNINFRKADFGRGKVSEKYTRKKIQYVYKCKWIIGTDKCYDWGMCYDQKRSNEVKSKAKTKLSYTFYAYNFYQMKCQGVMERLIPYLDDYQLTMLKIQNFKNRAVPSGWWIDLSALEKVAMTKGGKDMEAKELLQMFFETGVLMGRSDTDGGTPQSPNWKPVIPIENTAASELQMFYSDLMNTMAAIEKLTGYNDVTLGQASSKTLVPGYESGQQSTNEALYPLVFSEENIMLRLAEAMICRTQQALKRGDVAGFAPALNSGAMQFLQISPDIAWKDFGIELEKRSSQDQKMWLMQAMQQDIANGFLNTSDAVLLVNTKNVKQAQMLWAYKVKKEKERLQQQRMQEIQAQNEGNQQAAQIAQQAKMQEFQMKAELEMKIEQMKIQADLEKEKMRIESAERIAMINSQSRVQVADTTGSAKQNSAHIAGQSAITKQQISNDDSAFKHMMNSEQKKTT
jgi:hypothetical protein